MAPTVLITGASGSIGRKLRTHFKTLGWRMRLLCLNPAGEADVLTADLATYDIAWARHFERVDAVIHLAGQPSPLADWDSVQRLNIDLTFNVMKAALAHGARRVVFASSNWVMAGYRFGTERLTTDMPPKPINPYGISKLMGERTGRAASAEGLSFLALRIGWCQHTPGNYPGAHMAQGLWGQQMWLSDRDLCQAMERAVLAESIDFAVLNLMSDNPGMRWDIEATKQAIGYLPRDGHRAVLSETAAKFDATARRSRALATELEAQIMQSGW
jgi:dTDP-4-dehydrorhamnose reductase